MSQGPASILLVESDDGVADMIADYVEQTMNARVTRVGTASEAVRSSMVDRHHVVLAELNLPDCDDLELARELRRDDECDVILMTEQPTLDRALEAMRLGVRDLLTKPFDMHDLGIALEKAVAARHRRHREHLRRDRLRRVSGRVIRERRILKQRVELVCRDLVGAYRRLAEKVVAQRPDAE